MSTIHKSYLRGDYLKKRYLRKRYLRKKVRPSLLEKVQRWWDENQG